MADNKLTRQQIYDRIRETSKDEYVLEEMKRLGFWKKTDGEATVPELLIKKETDLRKELNQLLSEKRKYQNKEAVLKEMRLKRMAEAKLKREETKKKREKLRLEKAEAWKQKKESSIVYLGDSVSVGLNKSENNTVLLQQHGLPVFLNEAELAAAMAVPLKELRFLSFSRKVSTVNHYQKFYLPKKSGGKRLISAPMPRLKNTQYWILENILNKIQLHPAAHGFVKNRSILSNASPHCGKDFVINMDVKDFFPSVNFKRVKMMLMNLGYSEKISILLGLLCTESVTEEVEIDGRNYHVQKGDRVLPQGAPTSPAITNILCYQLDKRLQGLAQKTSCAYTRYADDISFSSGNSITSPQQLVWRIKKILADEGFTMHPGKIRIMHKGAKQEVTGLVVNNKPAPGRKKLRKFRAMLHQLKNKGANNVTWGNGNLSNSILGYIDFVRMVNPDAAKKLTAQYASLFNTTVVRKINNPAEGKKPGEKTDTPPRTDPAPPKDDTGWWDVVS